MRIFNPPRNPWPRSIWKANIVIVFVLVSLGIASISRLATLVFAAAGDLDPTFGVNGKVTTNFFEGAGVDAAFATAIQPDGKIVAGGSTQNPVTNSADFALARYNIDGTLDTTFGSGGKVATDFLGFDDSVLAIAIQPDNKIIAAGYAIDGFNFESAVARYLSNGSLDTTFGNGGKVTASSVNMATAGAVQADGKIVIAGWGTGPGADYDFIVLRYNSNGTLDNSFGNGGKVTIHIGNDFAQGMVIQPDGKIVVAGYDGNSVATSDFALARLNVDGSLDSTFGIGGKVTTHFAAGAEAVALALGS